MITPSNIHDLSASLAEPDEDARTRSQSVCDYLTQVCEQRGGLISFGEYMNLVLYAPGLGYYQNGLQKFGESGDFITAPEVSPLFSRCLAKQVADILTQVNSPEILEFGAGSGVMAVDILVELEKLECVPERYRIIELSAELKLRQRNLLLEKVPHLAERVSWLDELPTEAFNGVVLANEVLDAMPVECFRKSARGVEALFVGMNENKPYTDYCKADDRLVEAVQKIENNRGNELPANYCSELNPALEAWLASVHDVVNRGLVLLLDYGYPAREYYLDERNTGTLICHYRHMAHSDPFRYPGLQDITANVDFTAVASAAMDAGFHIAGYTSQSNFLLGCGLDELFKQNKSEDDIEQARLAQQVLTLTSPSEMGERFKCIGLLKDLETDLRGFLIRDMRAAL